jgi:hypothetical protein
LVAPSTSTFAGSPTLTESTWELVNVAVASNDCVPMITTVSLLESALTVAPTAMPTEAMVPAIGLLS